MKTPDPDKERSEEELSLIDFLKSYNESLPPGFPRASLSHLKEFRNMHPRLFRANDVWTLDQHRKKFMDWLPQRLKSSLHQDA